MPDSIQEHISALRQEVERQYRDGLSAIADLEAKLLGVSPQANGAAKHVVSAGGAMGVNIDRVRSALSTAEYRSIKDLEKLSGLDNFAIRNALKTRTLEPFVERLERSADAPLRFRLSAVPQQQPPKSTKAKGVGGMVRDYLTAHPEGAKSGAIANHVLPKMKTKSRNPKNRVQSTLSKMKKSGALLHNADTGIYRLAKSK